MSGRLEQVSQWFYRGLWGVLARWFRVPVDPPALPAMGTEVVRSFRPAAGFLKYLKFLFWLVLLIVNIPLLIAEIALTIAVPLLGIVIGPVALFAMVAAGIVAYLAIHLRYDSTWYVVSDRSLRLRRGIWIIHETTITFENVQNVVVQQGPLQRFFGIADVCVQTAGGGGGGHGQPGGGPGAGHHGLIEGVSNAHEIRDLILSRLKVSRSSGLGDESAPSSADPNWSAEHLAALREIRDSARLLESSHHRSA